MELCRDAAARASREFRPEVVVAVARAGYVPGALVACLLRRDMVTLRLPSPVADGDPPVPEEIVASLAPLVAGRRALVVDEVNGTGGHLRRAQEAVRRAGASGVRTLTLLARRSGPAPDYCGAEGDVCVLQPWVARVIPW
ncbi:MAG: phosphoribosyltransferase [Armatimonadetes bacterium]|nr:phosphoribosyltransferase [Armatimonadota bacterium]